LCVFFWCEGNINQTKTPHNEVKQGRTLSDTRYSAKGTKGKWISGLEYIVNAMLNYSLIQRLP